MSDALVKALSKDGLVRFYAAVTTDMVNQAVAFHHTSPVATAALGRTLTGASIMGALAKQPHEKLTLQIKGDGPLGGILAVADSSGNTKGYVHEPDVTLPLREDGKLDVGTAVGHHGYINVIRDLGMKEPYIGQTPIISGEIAEDLAQYFLQSEQVPSALSLGVTVNCDGTVGGAGGVLVQLLPGATEETIAQLEQSMAGLSRLSGLICDGISAEELIAFTAKEIPYDLLETVHPAYRCDCSIGRIERALYSLGEQELKEMIAANEDVHVSCHFCDKEYVVPIKQLCALLAEQEQQKK